MLTHAAIAQLRLQNQQILHSKFTAPQEIVAWHGAIQAQDYTHAKWAVGLRIPNAIEHFIEQALNAGSIVRTHIMRPTWHLVAATDIRWMMALTAPQINAQSVAQHRNLGLDAPIFNRAKDIILQALENGNHLTRKELATIIERAGIPVDSMRMVYIMFSAELDALVCNGIRRGKEHTYALLDERAPQKIMLEKEEALAELAQRYFQSHAPATLPDFTWWSGLRVGDARRALEIIKPALRCISVGDLDYWLPKNMEIPAIISPSVQLLPAFDEFLVSYKDRRAALDPENTSQTITSNGIFKPVIVVNGRVVGTWNKTEKKTTIKISQQLFNPIKPEQENEINLAIKRFGEFVGKSVEMEK